MLFAEATKPEYKDYNLILTQHYYDIFTSKYSCNDRLAEHCGLYQAAPLYMDL